jgi:D-arabinono-1,4-lactone oxidase
VWQAKTMETSDYNSQTGIPPNFVPKPYTPLFPQWGLGSTLPSESIAATGFQLLATWPDWFYQMLGIDPQKPGLGLELLVTVAGDLFPAFYPLLADLYFPCCDATHPPKVFWDHWLGSLPMDQVEYSNNLFDLTYCEMWVPADSATKTINILNDFYEKGGYSATGFYTVELLAAQKSNFWLNPAFGTDAVRINILYFKKSTVTADDYFSQFWKLLAENGINFRPHWGKELPPADSTTGTSYLKSQYPKWDDFMKLRDQMDPHKIFLNSYWKTHLGIS